MKPMVNLLLTGASGMIGKGILLECMADPRVESVTLINRATLGIREPKVREVLIADFTRIDTLEGQLGSLDACFHCMGVSSMGMSEEDYTRLTFDVTRKLADLCYARNPEMTFNYVSGSGTDRSEKGRLMWARVKGRAENYVLSKGFAKAYMFRPGFIIPEKGIRSRTRFYDRAYVILRPFFPLLKKMNSVTTTTRIGRAMLNTLFAPREDGVHLENRDINRWAEQV